MANRKEGFRTGSGDEDGEGKNMAVSASGCGVAAGHEWPGAIALLISWGLTLESCLP